MLLCCTRVGLVLLKQVLFCKNLRHVRMHVVHAFANLWLLTSMCKEAAQHKAHLIATRSQAKALTAEQILTVSVP